ncbi:MAG: Imidazole glycerol phosphate synthase amidotransferase subunit [Firmicutes bacterium]|nr:Imidazole glycerol phosphate synthase amidotransferase subunit [Bacillota bacterium]MDI6705540.1 imidazole glycerol phosphate synthase subunit HisH [Bacillota bacterium]
MIAIIDYGMGNLRSVEKAVQSQGFEVKVSSDPGFVAEADKLILPGVGAFPDAMDNLEKTGLADIIIESVSRGKPLLGVCLGMQLLYELGLEIEEKKGLGFLKGRIEKLPPGLKIPHMGWNSINITENCKLLRGIENGSYMYFVHSYYAAGVSRDEVRAVSDYGVEIPAVVCSGKVYGTQFHPEKSGDRGILIYKNFGELVE